MGNLPPPPEKKNEKTAEKNRTRGATKKKENEKNQPKQLSKCFLLSSPIFDVKKIHNSRVRRKFHPAHLT